MLVVSDYKHTEFVDRVYEQHHHPEFRAGALLGFGAKMRVLGPRILVKQIKDQLQKTLDHYGKEKLL